MRENSRKSDEMVVKVPYSLYPEGEKEINMESRWRR